ncbi:MAG: thioesterase family protein [Eubacterium sp.]|nr:thioesterase family protein [Eubacterium sp.]
MLEAGIKGVQSEKVVYAKTAAVVGSGALEVYGTPCMIALIEKTALESVGPYLDEGCGTVGTKLVVDHLSATPIGMTVRCETELVEVDRRRLEFVAKVYDDCGLIGEATHQRFVVENEKFLKKASAKKEQM